MYGKIHEIYSSISGEGISQGIPTVFVRFAGCSLRCGKTDTRSLWCDTPYALGPNQGETKPLSTIMDEIVALDPTHGYQILLTGGEPLEGKNRDLSISIAESIHSFRTHNDKPYPSSRVETNGSEKITLDPFFIFTMDYKLPGSGMEGRMDLENFQILEKRHNSLDEIKFVVRDRIDFERSIEVIREQKIQTNILYSPVHGEVDAKELVEWIKIDNPPKGRLSLQIHKVLWGNQKGV
ncbi:Organic radical activating enzyme [Leptospira biflexa serovar Patoc strain 'Patoc 1 (Ames)']|uniref:7-carboxy-7-deazaguanine synthase n=1 Tax=Leptospira biflexa serovar Patoc (strain Patoc 1 / ATCC 23582 / Paris) TaxID=456481 RepID=B0SRW5_LEPBP|nr:7-carboxy-7-deazaguanine synthase QueE [Leptospira biflexa]ABZ95788.1 Organic radical activating enzyme [Leptospira biflexa serovar Patoc strain 'Patoc 1 (Ames)']ABZ99500.1 Putative organic radical activating enzyme [Leptospira biflexa serovar Patoc strain 'Patoc 1 (Paris)']